MTHLSKAHFSEVYLGLICAGPVFLGHKSYGNFFLIPFCLVFFLNEQINWLRFCVRYITQEIIEVLAQKNLTHRSIFLLVGGWIGGGRVEPH